MIDPEQLIRGHADRIVRCTKCQTEIDTTDMPPLTAGSCNKCGNRILVPMKLDHFWLFELIGAGGMGRVHKAFHELHPNSFYAVKTIPRQTRNRDLALQALQREAHLAAYCSNHPRMINVISHGWDKGEYFVAMDYLEGETLGEIIRKREHLPEKEVLEIALQIIAVEKHITGLGYLFRDLKPENVMLDKKGLAYLLDFGLCLPMNLAQLDPGETVKGTPTYIPPERLLGEGEDVSSEIYSLGMVLYHAGTGTPYFRGAEGDELAFKHLSVFRLDRTMTKLRGMSDDISEVLTKMIKRARSERHQDWDLLEADILALCHRRGMLV